MNTSKDLVESLRQIGETIQSIIRNFKKDPAERKTNVGYYEERLRRLTEAWTQFESQDTKLRQLTDAPKLRTEHEYFTEDYYTKISELTHMFVEKFSTEANRLRSLAQEKQAIENPTLQPQPTSQHDERSNDHQCLSRSIKARMTALMRLINGILPTTEIQPPQYYEFKINTINKLWDQIQAIYYEICHKFDEPTKYGLELHEYYTLEDMVQDQLVSLSTMTTNPQKGTVTQTAIQGTLPLPKITIPQFNGDYLKWRQFHDLFVELVDKQPISTIQKMWYLKTNLSGEAEHLIRQFSLTAENYTAAWKTLQDRYNNKRVLVSNVMDKLLNQSIGSCTASTIKNIHDITKESLLALNNLGIETATWDAILIHLLMKKLDKGTHIKFVQSLKNPREVPTTTEFLSFLEIQFQALEATGQKDRPTNKAISSVASFNKNNNSCQLCNSKNHKLYHCNKFLQWSEPMRLQWVQKNRLCVNCFNSDHRSKDCISTGCKKCMKKHNTLLHLEKRQQPVQQTSKNNNVLESKKESHDSTQTTTPSSNIKTTTSAATSTAGRRQGYVLLATAKVVVTAPNGISGQFRAVLDSGSQVNLVSKRLTQKLLISPIETSLCIDGVGKSQKKSNYRINVEMKSRDLRFSTNLEAYVLPIIIPPQPNQHIDISAWNIPTNITLADPQFHKQEKIDILLGAEFYYGLIQGGTIRLHNELPLLQNTVLGWIVGGAITDTSSLTPQCALTCAMVEDTSLEEVIEQLWKVDEIEGSEKGLSPSEKQCEAHFVQHVRTNANGRFVVNLPFRENPTALGESQAMAYNRFLGLERRLSQKKDIQAQYIKFMQEYEQLGHMERVDINTVSNPKYFIPHHYVLKPDSSTTKLRVVFDASAKTTSGQSLNDLMYTGPTVQNELFSILLRFRLPRFVFTTDIEKMYRQILVHPNDQKYQLIIWRENPSLPINYYKLNTVTYGTRAAPYLATKSLQRIADENLIKYPHGSQMLKHNFYVDDGLGGSDSLSIALETQKELITILKNHGFNLKKWCANHPLLLENIPLGNQEVDLDFNSYKVNTIKTLGLSWLPKTDHFCIKVKVNHLNTVSKRAATSDLARVFDPLGLLAPVVVRAKIVIQQLWQLKLDWDEPLPENLHTSWSSFRNDLENLNNMEIPRHIFKGERPLETQIHIFADASEKAFGAVAYLRAKLADGRLIVQLLCAKTRVAPLKQQTLPRLELCAAVIAAQLANRIKTDLQIKNQPIYLWTDSEIVLSWINTQSSLYQTFVANRVATIQSLTLADQWRHVASKDNPADILSRGLPAGKFRACNLWFYGPLFLHGREEIWPPKFVQQLHASSDIEKKKTKTVAVNAVSCEDLIYKIQHKNSFRRLQRILGYVLRFIKNLKIQRKDRPTHKALTPIELDESLFLIIRTIQGSDFSPEIEHLLKHKEVNKKSSIASLVPFLDSSGILRVGGRLEASQLSYDAKHSMLIPYNDPLARLLFIMVHEENNHCGPQALLNTVRQRFWPIKGKIMARSTVNKCIKCAKARPQLCKQLMGDLPQNRITPARPFVNAGVDYCGPFWIHHKVRGKKPTKAYIAVFCCFATKAIHLELVSDLTTEAFIGALKRFISRRGRCQNIYSDNATNFVGAKNQLLELADSIYSENGQELITSTASSKGIQFRFIPPRAPHFGGLWEAAVKSAKYLLLRSVATAALTYEELETIIIEIEAILNSRPLTPISNDPNDLEALTPGHFLIGEALTSQIDSRATQVHASKLSHWKLLAHLKQEFWSRWSSEYLNQLQQRHKWNKQVPNLRIGDMVIIKEDNLPVMKWPLARIIELHPGDDGIVRVVEVKTANGLFKRPIHRLALLPTNSDLELTVPAESNTKNTTVSTDEPKAKRIKNSLDHLTLAVLTVLLILPLAFGTPVKNQEFGSRVGIHFEQIGTTAVSTTEWNLFVYYNLTSYWAETAILINGTRSIETLCKMLEPNSSCLETIQHFEQLENELRLDNILLRGKRGALDVVGNVAHSLFGILDSEYAEQMSETIEQVKQNEAYLLKLLKNQTSIVDSTLNIIRQNQITAKARFERLEREIKIYSEEMHNINKIILQLQLNQLFNSAVIQLNLIANNMKEIQSSILGTLMDTRHGKISPRLLTPEQLQNEANKISLHSPQSLSLPVSEESNLLQLFKLMKIRGRLTQQHAIFKITLPLVEHERFSMFHLVAVPNLMNSTMVAIKPCTTFLGINVSRKQYIPFTNSEFSSCDILNPSVFICSNIQIRYNYGSDICTCELNLFNNKTTPTCSLEKTDARWIPLNKENQWIYATSLPSKATAVCNREILPISLKGSGLLSLDPECMLRHNFVTINGQKTVSSIVVSSYTSLGQLSELSLANTVTFAIHSNHSNSTYLEDLYARNIKELSNLQKSLKEENIMDLPNKLKTHQVHTHMISYTAVFLSIITFIMIALRRKTCRNKRRRHATEPIDEAEEPIELQSTRLEATNVTPTPRPRQPQFTLDV